MSFANKYNKKVVHFDIDTSNFEFKTLEEMHKEYGDSPILLKGVYINKKSKFGDKPIFATTNELVSVPKHLLSVAEEIIESPDDIEAINNDSVGFVVTPYTKNGETYFTLHFTDVLK